MPPYKGEVYAQCTAYFYAMKQFFSLLLPAMLLTAATAAAQTIERTPVTIGTAISQQSKILNQQRTLNIYTPADYDKHPDSTYPVIYLLDGAADEDFVHITGLVQYLNMIDVLPPSIVVGIANVDRRHDLTAPSKVPEDLKLVPTSGGSAAFMDYIEKEVEPQIQHSYRCNGHTTLIGQSLGGLFATEILLRRPQLFSDYIIISPSLWWSNEALLHEAPQLLSQHDYKGIRAYISVGAEGEQMENDAAGLIKILQSKTQAVVLPNPMPGENHLTILHRSVYKAFEMLQAQKK